MENLNLKIYLKNSNFCLKILEQAEFRIILNLILSFIFWC